MTERDTRFEPNSVIRLEDVTQLQEFEEAVIDEVAPDVAPTRRGLWTGRVALKDLLRVPKFNGRITDIELAVIEDPVTALQDAAADGAQFIGSARTGVSRWSDAHIEFARERALAFDFSATARSSRQGTVGNINTTLWYVPESPERYANSTRDPVKRSILRPRIDRERFTDLHRMSRQMGHDAVRQAIRRRYSAGTGGQI